MQASIFRALRSTPVLVAVLLLLLGACGGGGGGGGGGVPGPGSAAPTASWISPTAGLAVLFGEATSVRVLSNDDGAATVTIVADADGNLGTTGDQTTIGGPTGHAGGMTATIPITTAALPSVGTYTPFIRIVDADNPAIEVTLAGPLTVYPAIAAGRNLVGGFVPRNRYAISGNYVFVTVGEGETGPAGTDFTGDMDTADCVVAVLDTTNVAAFAPSATSADVTGSLATTGIPHAAPAPAGVFAWPVREQDQGDLNGDMDGIDRTLAVIDTLSSTTPSVNTLAGVGQIFFVDALSVVVTLDETQDGTVLVDPNMDGQNDTIYANFAVQIPAPDVQRYSPWPLPAPAGGAALVAASDQAVGLLVGESQQGAGTDLNGDGDVLPADVLLAVSNLSDPPPGPNFAFVYAGQANLLGGGTPVDPGAAFTLQPPAPLITAAYYVNEATAGAAGADVNGNGLATDVVPAVWQWDPGTMTGVETILAVGPAPGGALNANPGPQAVFLDGTKVFFQADEGGRVGNVPGSNNDGDGTDTQVLLWYDLAMGGVAESMLDFSNLPGGITLRGLCLDGGAVAHVGPGRLAVVANETANGTDFNGVNGQGDNVLLLIDMSATPPIVHMPGGGVESFDTTTLGTPGNIPLTGVHNADGMVIQIRETALANGNRNGDGDANDVLLAYVAFGAPGILTVLDAGGDQASVSGGRIAATVTESYTGADLDGLGNGATGFALRVWDDAGTVLAGDLPSAQQSIPISDGGAFWVYLRDEILENTDLNGDGLGDLIYGLLSL